MTPEEETWEAARTRLHDLEHAVTEAQAAVDERPTDAEAKGKLDVTIAIRDAGRKALSEAEAALNRP